MKERIKQSLLEKLRPFGLKLSLYHYEKESSLRWDWQNPMGPRPKWVITYDKA